jgi:putative uncharacterized protein (fragment)
VLCTRTVLQQNGKNPTLGGQHAEICCMVEVTVEAETPSEALNKLDLNEIDVNAMPHTITEIDDVVETEEI